MSEPNENIRDEIARTILPVLDRLEYAAYKELPHSEAASAIEAADLILASPVIRRIQAEALREAADAMSGDESNLNPANPVGLAYINCTRIDAQELRYRADRIESGATDV